VFRRQPQLAIVTDSGLPAFRCALVKNVVYEDGPFFVFQEAGEDASRVAPYGDKALLPGEGHRVVPE
jgi:hypothetical protein